MAKRKKTQKRHQIDHIPKYFQQPRSPRGPKRRTDFSLFFCSSSSPSLSNAPLPQDSLLKSSSSKELLSSVKIAGLNKTKDKRKKVLEFALVQCNKPQVKRQGLLSKFVEGPAVEVESVAQDELSKPSGDRNIDKKRSDTIRAKQFTPEQKQITVSNDVCLTPGSVVWAKKACQLWWPAEILGERSTLVNSCSQSIGGHVLIQYYGKHESAWVDPATDLLQFEDCFEERSCNPLKEFQDALKQALHQREQLSECEQLSGSPDERNCSNTPEQSPGADKWDSLNSSRSGSDYLRRVKSKRERRPKVHFDDITFPSKSTRKVRRFRIMRFLGLAAPIGSPFSLAP